MNHFLLEIVWNVSPEIVTFGGITLRWYGILFALGLGCAGYFLYKKTKKNGVTQSQFEWLIIYTFIGIFLGARVVHCLFYEPNYYLSHWWEILLPISTINGKITFVGYHGLASHGGAAGLILGIFIYCWQTKQNVWKIMDLFAIALPLAGGFIRLGNLMNSEIVGATTDVPWAVVFTRFDSQPRHPAQLYEAIFYFALFVAMRLVYSKKMNLQGGFFVALAMISLSIFRFTIEFVKEVQMPFESEMTLNMGQWLSLPYLIVGIMILIFTNQKRTQK